MSAAKGSSLARATGRLRGSELAFGPVMEEWRYRLVVERPGTSDTEQPQAPDGESDGWELVSTKRHSDGRTEQRLFRKPA